MRKCKVKPGYGTCSACLDMQVMCNVVHPCRDCEIANKEYELMHLSDKYAVVMDENGALERVRIDRVTIIKDGE